MSKTYALSVNKIETSAKNKKSGLEKENKTAKLSYDFEKNVLQSPKKQIKSYSF